MSENKTTVPQETTREEVCEITDKRLGMIDGRYPPQPTTGEDMSKIRKAYQVIAQASIHKSRQKRKHTLDDAKKEEHTSILAQAGKDVACQGVIFPLAKPPPPLEEAPKTFKEAKAKFEEELNSVVKTDRFSKEIAAQVETGNELFLQYCKELWHEEDAKSDHGGESGKRQDQPSDGGDKENADDEDTEDTTQDGDNVGGDDDTIDASED